VALAFAQGARHQQRIVVEGGVLHHQRSTVDLRDVIALRVDQR